MLKWLVAQLNERGFPADAPDAEDWGWYTSVRASGHTYLLGASGDWAEPHAPTEWTVQLVLNRSLWNKISGANKMQPNDDISVAVEQILRANQEVIGLEVDRGA